MSHSPEDQPRATALVVAGDAALRRTLTARLARLGQLEVAQTSSIARGRRLLGQGGRPVLLVALEKSGMAAALSLIEFCRRRQPEAVVLAIDRVNSERSTADALAAGADDAIRVPFSLREFDARLRLRLRDRGVAPAGESDEGGLAKLALTPVEARIVDLLMRDKGRIVTRNELSRLLHDCDWEYGDRKFDVHITKIRKKLRKGFGDRYTVRAVRSVGYLLSDTADA